MLLLGGQLDVARAASFTVCTDGPPTCDYATLQEAVDAAGEGDVIKVAAGVYADVNSYDGLAQIVYISKSVTIQGGYTVDDWDTPDPVSNPTTLDAQGQGRGLYITGNVSPTVAGLRITGGDATGLGGGLSGKNAGGGVYIIHASATLSRNLIFNNAAHSGSGLFLWYSDATLDDNTIIFNTAQLYGGGLTLRDSGATLDGNLISANTANSDGGGLFLHASDALLSGNTIANNVAASYGGGLYLGESDATLSGNTIVSNTADHSGGLYLYASATRLDGNEVTSNTAAYYGGGVYLYSSEATLDGNTFAANRARYGGGLYLYFHSDATLTNTVVADNQASDLGSGLYIRASSPRLLHTTIARNASGDGRGVYVTRSGPNYSSVAMANTILVSHAVGIEVTAGNQVSMAASLWGSEAWANGTDWAGEGEVITGTVNLWADPAFVAPAARDYHIANYSPARDSGVDAGVTTDLDGQSRPCGDGYDVGADEFHPASPNQAPAIPSDPLPATGASDVPISQTLRWQGGDPDGDLVRYTIAWGTTSPPPIVATGLVTTHYDPGLLLHGSTYYWVVTATDGISLSRGPGWYFTVAAPPQPQLEVTHWAHPSPVQAGSRLTYTLLVTNTGGADLRATITDVLPAPVAPAGTLVWTPDVIAPHEVWRGEVVVTTALGYAGPLVNAVQVTTEEGATGTSTSVVTVVEQLITVGPLQNGTLLADHADGVTIRVQVPLMAVTEITQLGYTSVPAVTDPPADFDFAAGAFRLEAFRRGALLPALTFERPVIVAIDCAGVVGTAWDANTLELRYWDGHAWSTDGITVIERDIADKRLVVSVAHLSQFAVFAKGRHQVYLPAVVSQSP